MAKKKNIISDMQMREVLDNLIARSVTVIPEDVNDCLNDILGKELPGSMAEKSMKATLENLELCKRESLLACPDTGYPLFYFRVGEGIFPEKGLSSIYDLCRCSVKNATENNRLRKTMVHPLTRHNPGTNVLQFLPKVEIKFSRGIDYIEATFVPKGGGSEIFGTFYRMITPVDGLKGIEKFIIDSSMRAMESGKSCPPNLIGIGIGGTADLCMKLAKESALLRPVGSRHPEKLIADMEISLRDDINSLGIGSMGTGGKTSLLDLHIEYAASHTAALPVAFNCQCSVCRRATARIYPGGIVEMLDCPDWFERGEI
ncbi:MAG TPA: fumarate hydratase [bacterium]|nr:fumarate hydratase [bacterium]